MLTSKLAYNDVLRKALEVEGKYRGLNVKVYMLPIEVIAGLNTAYLCKIISASKKLLNELRKNDVILVPGTVDGDTSILEKLIGKRVYKASKTIEMLDAALKYILEGGKLDKEKPAEEILSFSLSEKIREYISQELKNKVAFEINGLKIPLRGPPILIASETSTRLPPGKAGEQARMFEDEGADIIIIGIPYDEDPVNYKERIDSVVKNVEKAVIGIESENPKAIMYGIERGASIVFGLYPSIMRDLLKYKRETAFTVLPCDFKAGLYPRDWRECIEMLVKNLSTAEELGFEKLIGDLILQPPLRGFIDSILAYRTARDKLDKPLATCISNVTELFEVDSHSLNAFLSAIACELELSIISVVEDSWRTRYSTLEAGIGLSMSYAALLQKTYPMNVGVDLCIIKERNKPESNKNILLNADEIVHVDESCCEGKLDSWGYVLIGIDYESESIVACMVKYGGERKCYIGYKAKDILYKMLRENPKFSLEHAGYLGVELEKAEIALKLGLKYVQDEELFDKLYNIYCEKKRGVGK